MSFLVLPFNRIEEAPKNRESIRDAYLKPGYSQKDKREDVNLDGNVDFEDIKNFKWSKLTKIFFFLLLPGGCDIPL